MRETKALASSSPSTWHEVVMKRDFSMTFWVTHSPLREMYDIVCVPPWGGVKCNVTVASNGAGCVPNNLNTCHAEQRAIIVGI